MKPIMPAQARLVVPNETLLASYVETRSIGRVEPLSGTALATLTRICAHHVAKANAPSAAGAHYRQFWLVAGEDYIGRVSLRPDIGVPSEAAFGHIAYEVQPKFRGQGFGHRALALGIEALRREGVGDLLLLCEDDNIASIKIIEAAGGELERIAPPLNFSDRLVRRYWIRKRPTRI